ncbi:MAG: TonB-dependent receptor [Ignavibacteriota bacterium]
MYSTVSFSKVPAPASGVTATIIVLDSARNAPIQLAKVVLHRGNVYIQGKYTDINGRAQFANLPTGWYRLSIGFVGYEERNDSIFLEKGEFSDTIRLRDVEHEEIEVGSEKEVDITAVDVKSGNQVFEAEENHASPNSGMVKILQENVLGAAKAPSGEVHIRGQHAEYAYYVDGIPIPPSVFGGFNEVVDDKVISTATFLTGALPAEYGGSASAAIVLQNHVPTGLFHLDLETYAGSYLGRSNTAPDSLELGTSKLQSINLNGIALSLSDHIGNFGFFLSGSRGETDRRIDEPLPYIYHDHGFDYFTYEKFDLILGENDYLTSNINWAKTRTLVPFDPVEEGRKNDLQNSTNSYQTLSLFHTFSREVENESDLSLGLVAREGSLVFTPGSIDPHNFYFANDTLNGYILNEDRSYSTFGFYSKFNNRLSHDLLLSLGMNLSRTNGAGIYTSFDTIGNAGPIVESNFNGTAFGAFIQSEVNLAEWSKIELGVRYDQQVAPDRPLEKQFSPRLRFNIFIDDETTIYASYGKYMTLASVEGIRSLVSAISNGTNPSLSERDDAYELGFLHVFDEGLRGKMDIFQKISLPGVDDQTIGASSIETEVNISKVNVTGVEAGLSYSSPLIAGYLNASIIHAYGSGQITGGFLPISSAGDAIDLDHDQRMSVVASLNYTPKNSFINATATYGSGLTNGSPDVEYKTGLFDFNQAAHTTPAWIVNISAGYIFHLDGGATIQPALYINNLFDHEHLLKGAFFSGASWEEPRSVLLKLSVHL